jgi:hypothetical protein
MALLRKQCIQNLLSKQGRRLNPITIKTLTKHSGYGLTDVKNCVLFSRQRLFNLEQKNGPVEPLTRAICKCGISYSVSPNILLFLVLGHGKWFYLEHYGAM